MMDRRTFITMVGGTILATPFAAEAQEVGKIRRLGVLLYDGVPPGLIEAFREGLRELGYAEGKNMAIELRDAGGKNERLSTLADELVQLKVEVILAVNTPSAHAAKKATKTIPIVITRVADPVRSGLVPSLARPGGNITGLSILPRGLDAKRIQLLREIVPGISRVILLFNVDNPGTRFAASEMEDASAQLGLPFLRLPARGPTDLPGAFQTATRA